MEAFDGSFEMINPKLIVVDHRYQRQPKPNLISTIAMEFKWSSFGALVCYWRNEIPYCVDGQQRLAALLMQDPVPTQVPCVVFPQSTIEVEAKAFLEIQVNRKAVNAFEKHRAELQAKIPSALAIQRAVDTAGYTISEGPIDANSIQAVRTLHYVYNQIGEEGVVQTLVQARDAWPNDQAGVSAHMLRVLSDIIMEQDSKYERSRLTKALSRSTPGDILRKGKAHQFDMGGSAAVNIRRAIKTLCKV